MGKSLSVFFFFWQLHDFLCLFKTLSCALMIINLICRYLTITELRWSLNIHCKWGCRSEVRTLQCQKLLHLKLNWSLESEWLFDRVVLKLLWRWSSSLYCVAVWTALLAVAATTALLIVLHLSGHCVLVASQNPGESWRRQHHLFCVQYVAQKSAMSCFKILMPLSANHQVCYYQNWGGGLVWDPWQGLGIVLEKKIKLWALGFNTMWYKKNDSNDALCHIGYVYWPGISQSTIAWKKSRYRRVY